MNAATLAKREQVSLFLESEIESELPIKGVVVTGSVAAGLARLDSDIDAVVFLDPYDLYAVPAEFKWEPIERSYHGIFSHIPNGIQFDLRRLDLAVWSKPTHIWPEHICAELSEGWLAFDRNGSVGKLVAERTKYTDKIRQLRLDEAVVQLGQLLDDEKSERNWATLGAATAHLRLDSAYDYLVQGLFAYNGRWRIWRSRELSFLLTLPWLPEGFQERLLQTTNALSETYDGYRRRLALLQSYFDELIVRCQEDGLYGANAGSEAFIRHHDEPGRNWNMVEWNQLHARRRKEHPGIQI